MQRSEPLDEKQEGNLENESQIEPKTKKSRSDNRISKIATMDNGTLVEAFKFLNYKHLAKSSFVSKRFWNVICTNRHYLPLLYVGWITMRYNADLTPDYIKIFDKRLSAEEYNNWVIHNQYTRQIPFESQADQCSWQSTQCDRKVYYLTAYAVHNHIPGSEPGNAYVAKGMTVFSAPAELDHDNWPLFQHFVRLITDPFVYIHLLSLINQNDVFNLLAKEISPKRDHILCKILYLNLDGDSQKFVKWITDHALCSELQIWHRTQISDTDDHLPDELLVDLFLTGARFTSEIRVNYYAYTSVITEYVQKFMDFKKCDEYQLVEYIECDVMYEFAVNLKSKYAKFIVNEERDRLIFEFINNDIGKKLQITHRFFDITRDRFTIYRPYPESRFTLDVTNL